MVSNGSPRMRGRLTRFADDFVMVFEHYEIVIVFNSLNQTLYALWADTAP